MIRKLKDANNLVGVITISDFIDLDRLAKARKG